MKSKTKLVSKRLFTNLGAVQATSKETTVGGLSERQSQIVDVAMRIIATQGARHFTVQVLATEVGVTGGAIYRHFESMGAIVDAIVERMGHLLFDDFPPKAIDPIERLRLFILNRAHTIRNNPHVSRLLLSDNLSQACGPEYAERLEEFKRRTQRFIVSCLREAAEVGILAADVSPEVGAVVVIGAVHAVSHVSTKIVSDGASAMPFRQRQPEALAEQVWAVIERALRASSSLVNGQEYAKTVPKV